MITSKYMPIIVAVAVSLCLLLCGFIVYAANVFDTTSVPDYQEKLFGDEIITLDIQVDKTEWQDALNNAQAKEWISGDLIINGERFSTVGIRTKGNSSLSMGSRSGSSDDSSNARYSLQFKFNKYVKGQTYYGLDTFCINNLMGDATYMKDYLSYEIMNYIGVESPLTNYANVTVNGEDYGFCIALERYDKSYLDRAYSTSGGQLYSVKIGMGRRGDFEDMWQDGVNEMPNRQQGAGRDFGNRDFESGDFQNRDFSNRGGMGGFGGMGGNGGGSLVYTDDSISSYSAIFDNAVFSSSSDKDKQRVIKAIENLNAGTDLEKYFDVDEILRYLAAHTVVVNLDSYTSNMQQNYYIYEKNGKIAILPWDYGLAFGGFQSGNASSVVNFPIDTPVSGVSMEDRPLINKLLEVDEYREKYHEYLQQIVEGYFESGLFESTINDLDAKINQYVKNDPSSYYTYEQYQASLPVLIELGNLRAESIKGQLDGSIPSTSSGQNADSSALVDTTNLNLSALGSMMGGMGGNRTDRQNNQSESPSESPDNQNEQPTNQDQQPDGMPSGQFNMDGGQPGGQGGFPGGDFDMDLMQQAMQIIMESGGQLTDEAREALLALGITEEQIEMFSGMQNGGGFGGRQNGFPGQNSEGGQGNMPGGNNQQGSFPGGSRTNNPSASPQQNTVYAVTVILLMILLAGAILFVAKPRKNVV